MHWQSITTRTINTTRTLLILLIAGLVSIACIAGTLLYKQHAYANDLILSTNKYVMFKEKSGYEIKLGVMAVSPDGRNAYCMQAGPIEEPWFSSAQPIQDSDAVRRIAWLADRYQTDNDGITHAAIATLVKQYLESGNRELWESWQPWIAQQYPQIAGRTQQLWQEAGEHLAQVAQASIQYEEAMRTGTLLARVLNSEKQSIAGVAYSITLQGPAVFDANNSQTITGTSVVRGTRLPWHATGDGEVHATLQYAYPTLERLDSAQDFARYGDLKFTSSTPVSFQVEKTFQPTLSSQATPHVINPNDTVHDTITSAISPQQHWKTGISVYAQGYYFTGNNEEQLGQQISAQSGENSKQFLVRLAQQGHKPVAYAAAKIDKPNQQIRTTAYTTMPSNSTKQSGAIDQDKQNNSKLQLYHARVGDTFGTWVWIINKSAQRQEVAQWLRGNYTSSYMEKPESISTREILQIDSTVTEHTAHVGSSISDTITVQGFPKDHGKFRGDTQAGFNADLEYMTVKLYWAGDHNNSARNEEYKPSTTEIPGLDEHHTLVGQWQYRAVNGTIRVGNGSKDIHGKPVNIEANEPGYYVFVLDFEGDSRVMPAQSEYNNAWERVWVPPTPSPTTEPIIMTTAVNADRAAPGDTVFDTARIRGSLPKGAYITFSAYEVPESISSAASADEDSSDDGGSIRSNINTAWKVLLDEYRVELPENSNTLMETSKQNNGKFSEDERATSESIYAQDGTLYVSSKHIQVAKSGKVYWKATLWSAGGDVLASHPLGIKGEVTTVEEPPSPPQTPPEEPHELAQTGAHTVTLIGVGVVMALIGLVGMSVLRVNGYRHSREQ